MVLEDISPGDEVVLRDGQVGVVKYVGLNQLFVEFYSKEGVEQPVVLYEIASWRKLTFVVEDTRSEMLSWYSGYGHAMEWWETGD